MNSRQQHKRVLFYRRLKRFLAGTNGGNLKVRDYFDHVYHSDQYAPYIYFSEETIWHDNPGNVWQSLRAEALPKWEVQDSDLLFFSGADWLVLNEADRRRPPAPVINIAQPRHTRPEDKRHAFLRYPAIRIAKSPRGADILRAYGVNGPLFCIPDAIDLKSLPPIPANKDIDILILGLKQPELARALEQRLQSLNRFRLRQLNIVAQLPPKLPTRADFLRLLARAKIVACIPLSVAEGSEGFYLPALEGMALECVVVCPHAVGNLDHCLHDYNCIVPEFTLDGLAAGVKTALQLKAPKKRKLIQQGLDTVDKHRIEKERAAFLDLLHQAPELWADKSLFLNS
ncbi:MAG: hypothetical protein AAGG75_05615 [Bacteroidota bacterium]